MVRQTYNIDQSYITNLLLVCWEKEICAAVLFNNSIVLILNIAYHNILQEYVIVEKEFLNKVNVYESPCE